MAVIDYRHESLNDGFGMADSSRSPEFGNVASEAYTHRVMKYLKRTFYILI